MNIGIILTIVFGTVSVLALLYAVRESRKAKRAEAKIVEIEKAVVSYKYLKDKAFANYESGRYEESLDVFRKYLLDNKDEADWQNVIRRIFNAETQKIFGQHILGQGTDSVAVCIMYYLTHEDRFKNSPKYPTLLKELIKMYSKSLDRQANPISMMISLIDNDWPEVVKYSATYTPFTDKDMNERLASLISRYCEVKIGKPLDNFEDDIPF